MKVRITEVLLYSEIDINKYSIKVHFVLHNKDTNTLIIATQVDTHFKLPYVCR